MMNTEELFFISIMTVMIGLLLFYIILFLYRWFKPVYYRLPVRNRYAVCSVNGDDTNDSVAVVSPHQGHDSIVVGAPLATIREALKRARISDIDGIEIAVLAGHIEYIGEEPLVIDSDNVSIISTASIMPTILFDKPNGVIEIIGSDVFFGGIGFCGFPDVENRGIVIDDGKQNIMFARCMFNQVGCVTKAW